jgi:hypothetical protein
VTEIQLKLVYMHKKRNLLTHQTIKIKTFAFRGGWIQSLDSVQELRLQEEPQFRWVLGPDRTVQQMFF